MIYHLVAINTPFCNGLIVYHHSVVLPKGKRVLVRFNNRLQVGIVWEAEVECSIDSNKVLPVNHVFEEGFLLPQDWFELIAFASRYYHYPLGQTVFLALPKGMKSDKTLSLPQPIKYYSLSQVGHQALSPQKKFKKTIIVMA